MLRITLLLFIVGGVVAPELFNGVCPDVKAMPYLTLDRFTGKWFEAARYYAPFQVRAECATFNHARAAGGAVRIQISQTVLGPEAQPIIDSTTTPIGKPGNAKWTIKKSSVGVLVNRPYLIVATDYEEWAILWSCKSSGKSSTQYSWILARKGYRLSDAKLAEVYNVARKNRIDPIYFMKTNPAYCH